MKYQHNISHKEPIQNQLSRLHGRTYFLCIALLSEFCRPRQAYANVASYFIPHLASFNRRKSLTPLTVAMRSGEWVFGCSLAGISGSNPAGGHGCLSLVSVVCCHVEFSATSWSPVQNNSTECGVSQCDLEDWTVRRPWLRIEYMTLGHFLHIKQLCMGRINQLPILSDVCVMLRPPLWSSGQRCWLQIQKSRVRSPALPDFLSNSGSGTGSTQPREVKLRSYLNKKISGSRFRKQR